MNRRSLIGRSGALALAALLGAPAPGKVPDTPLFFELRRYDLRIGPMTAQFDDFFATAAIPALRRAGAGPIGVFDVLFGADAPSPHVLIPYPTLDALLTINRAVEADPEYRRAGAAFLNASAENPAFVRIASSLMVACSGVGLGMPAQRPAGRVVELRRYDNPGRRATATKIGMFADQEIALFRRHGMQPVFFGETLIGPSMPDVTYMLAFDSVQQREERWDRFRADPDWARLSRTAGLTAQDLVSAMHNILLRPTAYSQI